MFVNAVPLLFAVLWSTGFIGARFGLPYIEPFTFLALRFLIALIVLSGLILCFRLKFPRWHRGYVHVFGSGLLIHVGYLGGVFCALKMALPVGDTAIIVGMQPILTALIVHRTHLLKILLTSLLGFVGLLCVMSNGHLSIPVHWNTILPACIALIGITLGTLYQKNKCSEFNVVIMVFLQYIPAGLIFWGLSTWLERGQVIVWNGHLIFALLWLALVLSIGTILLLSWLYKKHSATKVANFFYLAPPLTLIQGHFFFGEPITGIDLIGMVLVVASLYIASRVLANIKP